MKNLCWLSSYPKSGNTWFRIFFENLMCDNKSIAYINSMRHSINFAGRINFDNALGVKSTYFSDQEIEQLIPIAFEKISNNNNRPIVIKIHRYFQFSDDDYHSIYHDYSIGAIYIVRNPLEVCLSLSHHSQWDIDKCILKMSSPDFTLANYTENGVVGVFQENISTWSQHVVSWLDNNRLKIHLIKYEDLVQSPFESFSKALTFMGLNFSDSEINRAISNSTIEKLQMQEKKFGFKEKMYDNSNFFRCGQTDSWKKVLSESQINRIINDHEVVMTRLGYL